MMKKLSTGLIILIIIFCGLVLAGCSSSGGKESTGSGPVQSDKLKVIASIYPVYDFAKNVGGDRIDISCLVPPGAEPHEWEPSPRDMVQLQNADVFIYCGAGMEQWVAKTLETLEKSALPKIDASKNIELLAGHDHHHQVEHQDQDGDSEDKHGEEHHHSVTESDDSVTVHEHEHEDDAAHEDNPVNGNHAHESIDIANADPHIWVDPLNAINMVENITAGLVEADPANKSYYEHNAGEYCQQLMDLHKDYQDRLTGARGKEFVTSHDAFGYLAKQYGLIQVPLRGLSPEVEPTPARMVEVVKLVREKEIRYIFFESLVSPKVSEVIAAETGVEILVLNPVGGLTAEEIAAGKDYLSVMRENLANLQKSFNAL